MKKLNLWIINKSILLNSQVQTLYIDLFNCSFFDIWWWHVFYITIIVSFIELIIYQIMKVDMWLLILIASQASFYKTLACLIHCQISLVPWLWILPFQTIHVYISIWWFLLVSSWKWVADFYFTKILNTFIGRWRRWAGIIYSIFLCISLSTVRIKI